MSLRDRLSYNLITTNDIKVVPCSQRDCYFGSLFFQFQGNSVVNTVMSCTLR